MPRLSHALPAYVLAAMMAASLPALADGPVDRARAAASRGELRAAQIEWRNAVRASPDNGAVRAGLAQASLAVGDTETAEREARAALEHGYDAAAGTALLLRVYLAQNRARDLLVDFPQTETPPAVAGQIAAARAIAQLATRDLPAAKRSVELAQRLAPDAVEPGLAAVSVALAEGDRAAAEARLDQVLAAHPESNEAWLRKGGLQLDRGDREGALASFTKVIDRVPGEFSALLRRAEVRLRSNDPAGAGEDITRALAIAPNNATAVYLRAMQLAAQSDWPGTDAALQRIMPQLSSFPDGFLLLALAKGGQGQTAQAEDAARRHVARNPDDPRGAKLLASMAMNAGRVDEAAAVLTRATQNKPRDAALYDALARVETAAGRPAEAVQAMEEAARIMPDQPAVLTRLAVARMAAGDPAGTQEAARRALALQPDQAGAREMLVAAALARGDVATAQAEYDRLAPAQREGEVAAVLEGTLRLVRLDLDGARQAFQGAVDRKPDSVPGRIGLARVLVLQDRAAEAVPLLAGALRDQPGNTEALARLVALARGDGPAANAAAAALGEVQAAYPANASLALNRANLLLQKGDKDGALALLETPALRSQRGVALPLARAELNAAAGQFEAAETAARAALAEDPSSVPARRQLSALMLRRGDKRGAEDLLRLGLRNRPGDPVLQQTLIATLLEGGNQDAALAEANRLARAPDASPGALGLPGDLLMTLRKPQEAADAYAAALARAGDASPAASSLVLRLANAWRAAGKPADAQRVLDERVAARPDDLAAQAMLAQFDLMSGRLPQAEERLRRIVAAAPEDAVTLNNLAWVLGEQDEAKLAEARGFAERAYYLAPNRESADTLGWILARSGDPAKAVPLLRRAVAEGNQPSAVYHLAYALHQAGDTEAAKQVLAPVLASSAAFSERAAAERLRDTMAR